MKKKVVAVVFPLVLAVVCSFAVWANDQATPQQGGCGNCAKMQQSEPKPCCAKKQQAAAAQDQAAPQDQAAKPCCDKEKQAALAAEKPCCNKAEAGK